jgi:predicted ester cyclase
VSTRDLKALERHFFEEWNKGKAAAMAVIDETTAPNAVVHDSGGRDRRGLKAIKQWLSEEFDAFPDQQYTIDDMVAEVDKVAVRFTLTQTHTGEVKGIRPTNKKVTLSGILIDRVAGGKFVETWVRTDTLGFEQQLGLVPTPGKRK